MSASWGYKLTFFVYFEAHGDAMLDEFHVRRIINAVAAEVPDAHFLGVRMDPVQDEPKDQVTS